MFIKHDPTLASKKSTKDNTAILMKVTVCRNFMNSQLTLEMTRHTELATDE